MMRTACISRLALSPRREFLDGVPFRPQHGLAVAAKPVVEERGVDAAKIRMEPQIAGIKIREARVLADDATVHRRPGHEETGSRAMVGAAAGVFVDAPAKFREGHQPYPAVVARRLQSGKKATDGVG